MEILNHFQIKQKIMRLAYEILENNLDECELILVGINNNGFKFAELLTQSLTSICDKNIKLSRLKLNPANPLGELISIDLCDADIAEKSIILVDDVANTGRTMFYAFKVFMHVIPKKLELAVLVDRKHKHFPTLVDYVGLSLATTVQEHIKANLRTEDQMSVVLI